MASKGRKRAPYPPEYRRQMVDLVRAGRTPEELEREFEPTAQTIRNWVAQADRDEGPVALPPGRLKLSTILQSGQAFAAISIHPLANRPRADACSFRDRFRRLPVLDLPCNPLSTSRR